MTRLTQHALFWPATTLALLLIVCAAFNPSFLSIAWRDGHFFGNLVDILNRAAPLMVVSLGMTLVIAVRANTRCSTPHRASAIHSATGTPNQ